MRNRRLYRDSGIAQAGLSGEKTKDIQDNATTVIKIGEKDRDRSLTVWFTIAKQISDHVMSGSWLVINKTSSVELVDDELAFIDSDGPIEGLNVFTQFNSNDIELVIQANGVGENMKMTYEYGNLKIAN